MQTVRFLIAGLMLLLCASAAPAAHTQARLLLSADTARPGDTVMAGVQLRMDKGWHTYWRNGGDSGKGTEIKWTLPAGVTAGPIQWPVPEKLDAADQFTYVYEGEATLLVSLTLSKDLPPGELTLKAGVFWLECETLCVPGKADLQAKLNIGPTAKPSADVPVLDKAKEKLPRPHSGLTVRAWWEKGPVNDSRPLVIEWSPVNAKEGADYFPYENDQLEVSGVTTPLNAPDAIVRVRKTVKKLEGDWPTQLPGLVIAHPAGSEPVGYEARPEIAAKTPAGVTTSTAALPGGLKPSKPLFVMLGLAFLGGLILNIMPCVLPVISLKILSFVKQSREAPGRVRQLGLIYVAGVLLSFLIMAGLVIAVQQAGRAASWGMQFQNPTFLVAITILVVLVSLNLFGVFEVNLGGSVMGSAGELASRGGAPGAFFNGVLATILATPCTAPFLAPALGFAFAQPPAIIGLMFLAIGLGLAAPYLLLSFKPAWLRFLPKPGPWMERFKIIMGFPMLGTAFWLFSLTGTHLGKSGSLWFGIFLVTLALAAWIWGEFIQRGSSRKGLAMAACVLLVGGVGAYALQQRPGIVWQPWTPEAVNQARAAGRPVLVDFTADWCLTCQYNKRTSLEVPAVEAKLKDINAAVFIGDYTREDPAITAELKRFNRAGVPLVLVFPKDPNAEPVVLPEVLTRNTVLQALDRAAK